MTGRCLPCVGLGLPARDAEGVPRALPLTSFNFFFLGAAPSDISPAVASPSLPEPAPSLDRRAAAFDGRGVPERLPVAGVAAFLSFFLEDSFPLDSDSAGEPARFSDFGFFPPSPAFLFCVPLEPLPWSQSLEESFLLSSSFLSASSSSSSSSDELSAD